MLVFQWRSRQRPTRRRAAERMKTGRKRRKNLLCSRWLCKPENLISVQFLLPPPAPTSRPWRRWWEGGGSKGAAKGQVCYLSAPVGPVTHAHFNIMHTCELQSLYCLHACHFCRSSTLPTVQVLQSYFVTELVLVLGEEEQKHKHIAGQFGVTSKSKKIKNSTTSNSHF